MTAHRTDPLEARLSKAGDSIRASAWLPPQWGEVPRIRVGKRWVNVLWVIPIAFVVLLLGIAVCEGLYATPCVSSIRRALSGHTHVRAGG